MAHGRVIGGSRGLRLALLALGLGLAPLAAGAQGTAGQDEPATTTAPGDRPMPGGMQEAGAPETMPGMSGEEVVPPRQPGTATGAPGEGGVADALNRGMMDRVLGEGGEGGMGMQGAPGDRMMGQGMMDQGMMDRGMMGQGMNQGMGQGMMQGGMMMGHHGGGYAGHPGMGAGRGPAIPRLLFLLVDRDADGALSLEELREVQERVFREMDADGDGGVTPEEIQRFMDRMMSRRP